MKYPIGIQTFEKIRNEDFVYVDKTKLVYDLVKNSGYYFLSRPRRFGKSLLISTLKSYFEGKRELFKGLAIDSLEHDWIKYPVLKIDFNNIEYGKKNDLQENLNAMLADWEEFYKVKRIDGTPSLRLKSVIRAAYERTGKKVAILVDEYDKPMLANMETGQDVDEVRNQLKAFYSVLKSEDEYIRFGILTGVTRFSKVSVFSDLNNLSDISMIEQYSTICGISESELHTNFDESVAQLAEKNKLIKKECYAKLKKLYDGYHFEHDTVGIYNPFSLLNTFAYNKFNSYWFQTATPSFLARALKNVDANLQEKFSEPMSSSDLASVDSFDRNPVSVIFQSGYLTIKSYDAEFDEYTLGFPNEEVKEGFLKYLMKYYVKPDAFDPKNTANFVRDVRCGNVDGFMQKIQMIFARMPYVSTTKKTYERDFRNAIYLIFELMGFYVDMEQTTAKGRIDITVKTANYIYILELKVGKSADEALAQIEEKRYADRFIGDPRKIFKIGANFSEDYSVMTEYKIVANNK